MLHRKIILTLLLFSSTFGLSFAEPPLKKDPPPSGLTPLTRAIRLEKFEEAKKHITPELVNKMDQGQYHPLTYAVYTGNNDLIESLLKAGSNPNTIEHNGKTALYIAANLANPEAIKLLHKHGAKRPPKTALSPAVAAVHSSSLETLKTLLELYPDIDLNRGWKKPTRWDWHQFGCAINYATFYGYDDIALYLVSQNANTTGRYFNGQNALDFAVTNNRCSLKLVEALLAKGHSPIRIYHSQPDNSPNTPLAAAVVGGDINKVKTMAKGLNPEQHYFPISKAAQVAAACHKTEILTYLLGLLGEKIVSPKDYLKTLNSKYTKKHFARMPPNPDNAHAPRIQSGELSKIMPRATLRTSTAPATGSIAIISPASLTNSALLLTTALSKHDGITVLERDAVDKLLTEKSLKTFQSGDSKTLHQNLDLIPANQVIIFTEETVNKKLFVQVSIIDTGSGMITGRFAVPPESLANEVEIEQLGSLVLASMTPSLPGKAAISITAIKPEIPSAETRALANIVNTILPYHAANTRGCVSLARDQFQHLETEKAIGIKDSYWTAAWVIDGGIKNALGDAHTITLRATHPGNGTSFQAEHPISQHDTSISLLQCWNKLVQQLKLEVPREQKKQQVSKEPKILAKYAGWLLASGYPGESLDLLRACRALGDHNPTTRLLTLRARLATIPVSRSSKENRQQEPRKTNLIRAFQAVEYIHEFQKLCDAAIEYAETIHKNSHLQGSVTEALYELFYYRTMMDNTIIYHDYSKELAILDQNIAQLTKIYLPLTTQSTKCKHCKEHHARDLYRYDWDYYALQHPELNEQIAKLIWSKNFPEFPTRYPAAQILERKVFFSYQLAGYNPSKVWADMAQKLRNKNHTKHLYQLHVTGLQLVKGGHEKRKQGVNLIQLLKNSQTHHEEIRRANYPLGKEIDHLLGIEMSDYWSYSATSRGKKPPHGGISGYLWQDLEQARGTSEFRRMQGIYEWFDVFTRMNARSLRALLKKKLLHDAKLDPELTLSADDWQCLRKMRAAHGKETREITSLFNKLTSPAEIPAQDQRLQLSNPIRFPSIPNFKQHGQTTLPFRSAIDKTEAWIPTVFKEPRRHWEYSQTYRHAIQVVSLADQSVQTIIMPENSPKDYLSEINQMNLLPVILGIDKAYYHIDTERLFCIDRKTKIVSEVLLPLRYIHHLSMGNDGKTLYASLSSVSSGALDKSSLDTKALTSVVSIKNNQITQTLVSSQRKPAESPLDNPHIVISAIHADAGTIYLVGHNRNSKGRNRLKSWCGASYNLEKKNWIQLSRQELDQLRNVLYDKTYLKPASDLGRKLANKTFSLTEPNPRRKKKTHSEIILSSENTIAATSHKWGTFNDIVSAYQARLTVDVDSVDSDTFQSRHYLVRLGNQKNDGKAEKIYDPPYNYKGWWYSPNDLIEKRLFGVKIIGQWKNNYLVMLYGQGTSSTHHGFPALWKLPFKTIDHHLATTINKKLDPIHFDNEPLGSFKKTTNRHVVIETTKGFTKVIKAKTSDTRNLGYDKLACPNEQAKLKKSLYLYGDSAQIVITPTQEITSLMARASLFNHNHGATLIISAEVNGQWKKVCDIKRLRLIETELPPGTRRISITCIPSSKEHGIVIEDILLK